MRRIVALRWFSVAVIAIAAVMIAWYVRPIRQAQIVGVPWRFTLGKSHCSRYPAEVQCTTNWPPSREQTTSTNVNFARASRELLRVDRTWNLADSSAWAQLVDSIRRAVVAHGAEPLPCDTADTHFPIAEAWRAGPHEIRLYAAPRMNERGIGVRSYASVQLLAFGAGGCGPRYVVRLLTPAELARAMRDWIEQQIGY